MIKPGGGDRTSCKKPHPEQASPRLTVNKYSPLAALPSTVRALAPIAFQVQTGKGKEEREMADRRFNLLLAAVFIGGALPIQQGCQLPGIAPGPHFFLLTFIIVLIRASPQLASPGLRSGSPSWGLDKQPKSQRPARDRKARHIHQGCSKQPPPTPPSPAVTQLQGWGWRRWHGDCRVERSRRKQVGDLNFLENECEGYPFQNASCGWGGSGGQCVKGDHSSINCSGDYILSTDHAAGTQGL